MGIAQVVKEAALAAGQRAGGAMVAAGTEITRLAGGDGPAGPGGPGTPPEDPLLAAVRGIGRSVEKIAGFAPPTKGDVQTALESAFHGAIDYTGQKLQELSGTMASSFFTELETFLKRIFNPPSEPALTPVQADQVISQVAEALQNAEGELNKQSLVISNGTVELDLYLSPAPPKEGMPPSDKPGAHARIVFNIAPKH